MKRRFRDRNQEKELADQARLLKAWRAWHAEELEEVRGGPHGSTIAELMLRLDQLELNSAASLLTYVQSTDWSAVSYTARLVALHEVNQSIMRLRERHGLSPMDDPVLPEQPDNVFRRIRAMLLTNSLARDATGPA